MSDQVAKIVVTATDNASAVLGRVRGSLADVGTTASKIGPVLNSLGISLSAGLATAFFRGIVNGLDALNDLRDATGASIENISALEDVAARTGTSFESVGTALVKFNGALQNAKPGSDAEAAFKALGLSVAELKAQDPAEALRRTAVALAQFSDDGNKARLVQELFGKSLREVAPFLNDLATKGALTAKVTRQQAEEAEKFNQQLFALSKNSQDAARSLVSSLIPALSTSLEIFTKLKSSGLLGDIIVDAAKGVVGLQRLSGDAGADINKLIAERSAIEKRLADQQRLRETTGFKGKDKVTDNLQRSLLEIDKLLEVSRIRQRAKVDAIAGDYGDAISRKFQRGRPSLPDTISGAKKGPEQTEAERYLETLQKQLEKTQDLTVIEQVLTDIEKGRIKGITPEIQKQLEATAHQIDAANFLAAAEKEQVKQQKEVAEMYDRATEAARRYVTSLINENDQSQNRNKQLADSLEEMGLEADALDRLRIARIDASIAQQQDALLAAEREKAGELEIAQIERRIQLLREQRSLTAATSAKRVLVEEADANKKRTEALSKSIEDGILTGFRNGKGFADVFLDELKAQFAKTVLRPIIQPIAEAGSNLIGSFLKNFLSFDGGGYTGGGARAGGLDGKGGFLGLIHPQESIIDHTKGGRSGFSPSTQIVVQGGMSKGETYAAIAAALQERDRVWSDSLRAQGVLAT